MINTTGIIKMNGCLKINKMPHQNNEPAILPTNTPTSAEMIVVFDTVLSIRLSLLSLNVLKTKLSKSACEK